MRDRYTIARKAVACGLLLTTVLAGASAAQAQSCGNGPEGFDRWLAAKLWLFLPLSFLFTFTQLPMLLRHGLNVEDKAEVLENPPTE